MLSMNKGQEDSSGRTSTVPFVLNDPRGPDALQLATATEGDAGVVSAAGELDANSEARLRSAVDELLTEGCSTLILDLAGISFIDSSGLSALIYAYKRALESGGSLSLRSPSATVTRLLELTGQTERFAVSDA